jgi:uncharacterized protein (TIGR03435 family)
MRLHVLVAVLLVSIGALRAATQEANQALPPNGAVADAGLSFEVASIRPNTLGQRSFLWAFRNGRFTARYATLKALIQSAYGRPELPLTERQVIGGPGWLGTDRFDIEATTSSVPNSPRGTFSAPLLRMLRSLLEDRFGLRAHIETREFPLFALVPARKDRKLGPGIRQRLQPCTPATLDASTGAIGIGTSSRGACGGRIGLGELRGVGLTMSNLASGLSQFAGGIDRIVVDRTEMTGTFDVELHWRPDLSPHAPGTPAPQDSDVPSLFSAVEEQLGLKLERTRGPMDVVVIEHVDPPTAN